MDESITVERVRHALVVGRLDADGAAVLLAANLPPKRDRTFVVVGDSSIDAMTRLDPWVIADLADEVHGDLCVVAPGFGSMGRDGTLPPARLLADRLGVAVTAADGNPFGLADGSVFVPGPTAGWVSFRPGGERIPVGARMPAPWWQDGLPHPTEHLTHIPAGLWVRRPDAPDRPDDPLLWRVPDRDRMYVVLGAPGERSPDTTTVADALRALPDEGRDRAVLAWYGVPSGDLVREVAEELGVPVRVAHGVPGDGGLVYVDETGAARWRPFAVESVYRPGGVRTLERWTAPPTLAMAEPGSYRLCDGWRVDVVARGLTVRPSSVRPDPRWAAETGPTADIVVAGAPPDDVCAAFDRLVRELPMDTREGLRILPVDQPTADALAGIEAADRVGAVAALDQSPPAPPGPAGTVVVTADGRIRPAAPILTLAAPASTVDIQNGVLTIDLAVSDADPGAGIPTVAAASIAPTVTPPTQPVLTWAPAPDAPGALATPGLGSIAAQFAVPAPSHAPAPAVSSAIAASAPTQVLTGNVTPALAPGQVPAGNVTPALAPGQVPAGNVTSVPVPGQVLAGNATAALAPGQVAAGNAMPASAPTQVLAGNATADSQALVAGSVPMPGPSAASGMGSGQSPVAGAVPIAAPAPASASSQSPVGGGPAVVPGQAGGSLASMLAASSAPVSQLTAAPEEASAASVTGLLPAPSTPRPASTPIEVPADARSTAAQRRAMRGRLGSSYDVATRAVTRLLSERPGLRFGAGDRSALLTELAVVRVFADDPGGQYDADFYVCLADGLRRLPTARAVVVRGIPAGTDVRPASVIRLPTPVVAAPAKSTDPVGPAEALIWTTTARRLDGLVDDESRTDDVVLSGHTTLRVLAVENQRVLLAEDGTAGDVALTRLRAAAAARVAASGPASRWFGPLPAA